jgi:hypothetical protein
MEHNERMASISLKKCKYELRFAPTPTHGSGSPTTSESAEDKQIQILQLQIRLAELTGEVSHLATLPLPLTGHHHHHLNASIRHLPQLPEPVPPGALPIPYVP